VKYMFSFLWLNIKCVCERFRDQCSYSGINWSYQRSIYCRQVFRLPLSLRFMSFDDSGSSIFRCSARIFWWILDEELWLYYIYFQLCHLTTVGL